MTSAKDPDTSGPTWVTAVALRGALSIEAAADALEAVLRAGSLPITPQRLSVDAHGGQFLAMPAAGEMGVGAKLVTVQPRNPERRLPLVHSLYLLFSSDTMVPIAVLDGAELTRVRTAAVSAVATRHLARTDAARLLVFGTGVQARAHIEAMRAVRPIEEVAVVGRTRESAAALVEELTGGSVEARVGAPEDVTDADLVCTCTTASEPLFDGDLLAEGVHINAIGSFLPGTREVDSRTVARAQVFLEDRGAVLQEAGDLRIPLKEETIELSDVAGELGDMVRGGRAREDERAITLFKSVGVAWEDLVVAAAAAQKLGLG